jgi:enoyl-CoA hydratase
MGVALEARGPARVIRIDRASRHNALDRAALRALAAAGRAVARDPEARGIVLTGTAPAFIAGGDLREFARVRTAAGARAIARLGRDAIDALRGAGVPLVAAINGDAHGGGCELAAACDYRVLESHVRLHWVQGRFAIATGWGATARLVDLVGRGVAARWLLGARSVAADEAARVGFADEVVPTGRGVAAACGFIDGIAAVTTRAATRRQLGLVRRACGGMSERDRADELRAFARGWAAQEHQDAMREFVARWDERAT